MGIFDVRWYVSGEGTVRRERRAHMQPPRVRLRPYLIWGTLIGIAAGVAEAMVSAMHALASDYWRWVGIYFAQLGFAGWIPGLIGGLIVGKWVDDARYQRWHRRVDRGLCAACGHNLLGDADTCPRCGTARDAAQTQA